MVFMVFHACHIYAVKRAVDSRRGGDLVMNASYVYNLVWNAHQTAALHHKGLAKRYKNVWSSEAPMS